MCHHKLGSDWPHFDLLNECEHNKCAEEKWVKSNWAENKKHLFKKLASLRKGESLQVVSK